MIEREHALVIAEKKWHNLVDLVGVCVCVRVRAREPIPPPDTA